MTDNGGLTATSSPITITVELLNDNFADRIPIPSTNNTLQTVRSSNIGATKEPGEPDHAYNPGGQSVWWSWRAPVSGRAVVHAAAEAEIYPTVGVYAGSTVSNLTLVATHESGVCWIAARSSSTPWPAPIIRLPWMPFATPPGPCKPAISRSPSR